jgi:hypothetical protein
MRREGGPEKPSHYSQWNERPRATMFSQSQMMSKADIEEFRTSLVVSYGCEDRDIKYKFRKIEDELDDDRHTCLWLIYTLDCVVSGQPTTREVFSIKMIVPQELRQQAENIMRGANTSFPPPRAIMPAPTIVPAAPTPYGPRITKPGHSVEPSRAKPARS